MCRPLGVMGASLHEMSRSCGAVSRRRAGATFRMQPRTAGPRTGQCVSARGSHGGPPQDATLPSSLGRGRRHRRAQRAVRARRDGARRPLRHGRWSHARGDHRRARRPRSARPARRTDGGTRDTGSGTGGGDPDAMGRSGSRGGDAATGCAGRRRSPADAGRRAQPATHRPAGGDAPTDPGADGDARPRRALAVAWTVTLAEPRRRRVMRPERGGRPHLPGERPNPEQILRDHALARVRRLTGGAVAGSLGLTGLVAAGAAATWEAAHATAVAPPPAVPAPAVEPASLPDAAKLLPTPAPLQPAPVPPSRSAQAAPAASVASAAHAPAQQATTASHPVSAPPAAAPAPAPTARPAPPPPPPPPPQSTPSPPR